mmetsp:Transcript_17913/g.45863  ORF Transcript_17913/g.45863 Transcript_17913/m.45863 type:complete len:222 (+) Transcript_17913:837-1502(+)
MEVIRGLPFVEQAEQHRRAAVESAVPRGLARRARDTARARDASARVYHPECEGAPRTSESWRSFREVGLDGDEALGSAAVRPWTCRRAIVLVTAYGGCIHQLARSDGVHGKLCDLQEQGIHNAAALGAGGRCLEARERGCLERAGLGKRRGGRCVGLASSAGRGEASSTSRCRVGLPRLRGVAAADSADCAAHSPAAAAARGVVADRRARPCELVRAARCI